MHKIDYYVIFSCDFIRLNTFYIKETRKVINFTI